MSKKSEIGKQPPVGGEDFMNTLFSKATEGDWIHVMLLAAMALKEGYEAKNWHLSDDETERLGMAIGYLCTN